MRNAFFNWLDAATSDDRTRLSALLKVSKQSLVNAAREPMSAERAARYEQALRKFTRRADLPQLNRCQLSETCRSCPHASRSGG